MIRRIDHRIYSMLLAALFALLIQAPATAQPNVDSLLGVWQDSNVAYEVRMTAMYMLALPSAPFDPRFSLNCAQKLEAAAAAQSDTAWQIKAIKGRAVAYQDLIRQDSALLAFQAALPLAIGAGDPETGRAREGIRGGRRVHGGSAVRAASERGCAGRCKPDHGGNRVQFGGHGRGSAKTVSVFAAGGAVACG